jgi:hypothetical protein
MAETAAHLADHVSPPLPVRQEVLSAPKRLRWSLEHEPQSNNRRLGQWSRAAAGLRSDWG